MCLEWNTAGEGWDHVGDTDGALPVVTTSLSEVNYVKKVDQILSVTRIPLSMVQIHKRVKDGKGDVYYGKMIRVVRVNPTDLDRERWPSMFRGATKITLYYGLRKQGS